jgi:hypothetical protein
MHDAGTAVVTELISPDGTTKTLKSDPVWDPNLAFSPIYTTFSVQTPFIIPKGSTLHTTCTWVNNTSKTIAFPDEMRIFGAFFIGDQDATCTGNGRVAWPFGFALTDPSMRLSRTRLLSKVTRVISEPPGRG